MGQVHAIVCKWMYCCFQGDEKVHILEQFKDGRKDIYKLGWENKHSDLLLNDLELKLKELQLLRVSKGLQTIMKEDEGERQHAEEARMQARYQIMQKLHDILLRPTQQSS